MKKLYNILSNLMSDLQFTGACIDSRQVQPGDIFIAMVGEKCDGNDFIADAVKNGAVFVLCTKEPKNISVPYLIVDNPLECLTMMAEIHRSKLTCPVIAVTGSNGKTTVKEMIACILPQPSFATLGNFNNHLGVPLSILHCNATHKYAVFELGANHVGEIAHTVSLVKPDVTLINNIAPAHIDEFGGIEKIVQAKGEIYAGLKQDGIAVINDDDFYAHAWDNLVFEKQVIRYSIEHQATVYAQNLCLNAQGCACFELVAPQGKVFIELNVPGKHQVNNALAAASCCLAVGIDLATIKIGLCSFTGVAGRLTQRRGKNNAIILDDTYNANLRSVLSALDVLSRFVGVRVLVLGDMGELGDFSQEHHEIIGVKAREYGIELVMTCGQYSLATTQAFGTPDQHYQDHAQLVHALVPHLSENTVVLVKGSRSARMENIVHNLCGEY
jgi:UDP-N-acetylmuramoyl-tripeptide--D-alanyl-D-alanine ligase